MIKLKNTKNNKKNFKESDKNLANDRSKGERKEKAH